MSKSQSITLTGGGSGGHSYTAIAIHKLLQSLPSPQQKPDISYIGSHHGLERRLAQKSQIPYYSISTGKLRRYYSWQNFGDIFRVFWGIVQAFFLLRKTKTTLIISTGGFVSLPVVIAGYLLRIPLLIHEQTSRVGLANKIAGYLASCIMLSFASAQVFFPQKKVVHTGQPIREEILWGDGEACYLRYGLDAKLPLLYVTGGSQGSQVINQHIQAILPRLLERMNILHQCGKQKDIYHHLTRLKGSFKTQDARHYHVQEFFTSEELKDIFAATTCILGRSGALTVSEALTLGIPAIFIPLPHATHNEQYHNALYAKEHGQAEILEEQSLSPEQLYQTITALLNTRQQSSSPTHDSTETNQKIQEIILHELNKAHRQIDKQDKLY